jgi:hypothetical protein
MRLFLLLILSGILTYAIVRRSVGQMTRTPIWLLWSVLMTPIVSTVGMMAWGKNIPTVPIAVAICLVCWGVYWRLLDLGREQPQTIRGETPIVEPTNANAPTESEGSGEKTPIRPIDTEEEAILRTCFPWNIFFLERIEYRPQAVLCRGKLRTNSDLAYNTIEENVKKIFGDRFLVLFQTSLSTGKPFFAIVPNPQLAEIGKPIHRWFEYAIALLLLCLTLIPTTVFGAALARLGMRLDGNDFIDIAISGFGCSRCGAIFGSKVLSDQHYFTLFCTVALLSRNLWCASTTTISASPSSSRVRSGFCFLDVGCDRYSTPIGLGFVAINDDRAH